MWKEYPSTPDEAFKAARDGAYFAKEMRALRQLGKIGSFPFVPGIAVDTMWDFGLGDTQTIWLHHWWPAKIGSLATSKTAAWAWATISTGWRSGGRSATRHGASIYAPHDVDHRRQTATSGRLRRSRPWLRPWLHVRDRERNPDKVNSIQGIRTKLPGCCFDEAGCSKGIFISKTTAEIGTRNWAFGATILGMTSTATALMTTR
jgi:hypothetical protein